MRETWVRSLEDWNDRAITRLDADRPNPRSIQGEPWYQEIRAAHPVIRAEWEAFVEQGYELPDIEDLLGGPNQGNMCSWWRAGVLVVRRHAVPPLADLFPGTVDALLRIPGLL